MTSRLGTGNSLTILTVYYREACRASLIKKKIKFFFIYYEIQMEAVAKSYMRKGFLIYEEMRKYLVIFEEAVSHIRLYNRSRLNFFIYEENLIFFFISAY